MKLSYRARLSLMALLLVLSTLFASCDMLLGGLPETTMPQETSTTQTTLEDATSAESTPEETTPEETTPEQTTTTLPVVTTPEATTPEATTPQVTTPEDSKPEETTPSTPETPTVPATLAEQIAEAQKLADGEYLSYESTMTGTVVTDPKESSYTAGSWRFDLTDGTHTITLYYVPVTGTPTKGCTVTVTGKLTAYNGSAQFDKTATAKVEGGASTPETTTPEETTESTPDVTTPEVTTPSTPETPAPEEGSTSVVIADYAAANGWVNATNYPSIPLNSYITASVAGGSVGSYSLNTGKYYTNGENWRIYQKENATLTISGEGKIIVSVKVSYASEKTGTLTLNGANIASDTVITVNANSITFGIGNTGAVDNGQVRITAIEVTYGNSAVLPEETTPEDPEETTTTPEETTATPEETTATPEETTATPEETTPPAEHYPDIPAFSGPKYVEVNGNVPYFTQDDYTTTSYEKYSPLDALGRCGVAMACLGRDLMPTGTRGDLETKPSGWVQASYDIVDGQYLYNRSHLIGWQLAGEEDNELNLITGTRFCNQLGMLPFENMVTDYIKETGNHVLYRVTPLFVGDELVARGVLMEAWSVEDNGDGICFNAFVYNAQPGVVIDYATGKSHLENDTSEKPGEVTPCDYVANKNSQIFHTPDCSSVSKMSDKNKEYYTATHDEMVEMGYTPCGNCNP